MTTTETTKAVKQINFGIELSILEASGIQAVFAPHPLPPDKKKG